MNSQREEELKPLPCPFCGDQPEWECHEDPTYPQVECRNIECPIGMTNDQVSLESWNTRQAATDQGVVPVRGDSVSIDVSTDEVTAGNRVFGTFTGERNGDPERTWLAEIAHFNYPAEQGVGEAVAWREYTVQSAESLAGIAVRQLGDESRAGEIGLLNNLAWEDAGLYPFTPGDVIKLPVTHQPKPIEGGVPKISKEAIMAAQRVRMAKDNYSIHISEKEVNAMAKALLATQQPPEQD